MHVLWEYFGWPNGAIWGNVWAEPVCVALAAGAAFLFRDRIGGHLATWWHRLHGGHVRADLAAMERRLAGQAATLHEAASAQREKHHQELLDRGQVQHEATAAHLAKQDAHLTKQAQHLVRQ